MKKNLCFRVALLSCLVSQDVLWAMPPKGVPENEIVSYAGMPPELREFLVPREGQDVIQKREEDFLKLMLRIGDALRSYGIRNIEFILSPYREETGSWSAWAKPYLMEILSQMDIQTIAVRELDLDLIFGVLFQGFIEHKNSTKLMEIVNPSQGVIL